MVDREERILAAPRGKADKPTSPRGAPAGVTRARYVLSPDGRLTPAA